jgi:hypothetical protein
MSTLRLSLALAVVLAVAGSGRFAQGQITSGLSNGRHPGIFIEPDTFKPDFQFFAPADATDYETGRDRDPNKGFFFTYDRVYINVTRPVTRVPVQPPSGVVVPYAEDRFSFVHENPSYWEGDFTWGNRLEGGFIDCNDRGWNIVGWRIDGPNVDDSIWVPDRLGGFLDPVALDDFVGLLPHNYLGDDVYGPDDPLLASHSVNLAKLNSIEINRIMERHYLHRGGVIEPMIGVRYIQFQDFWRYRLYQRSRIASQSAFDDTEFYMIEQNQYNNHMLGGQAGFRLFKETGHWKLSSEFRMFALQNWQHYRSQQDNYIWTSSIVFPPGPRFPDFYRQERILDYSNQSMFVWGGELKLEAAYQLTKYISFRSGFTFMNLGQGVGRGRDLATNNQDVQLFGFTMGVDVNR